MSTLVESSPPVPNVFERVRIRGEKALLYIGGISDLAVETIREGARGPLERDLLVAQFEQIGVRSLSIVAIT